MGAEMIALVSPRASLHVSLVPPVEVDDARLGKKVVEKGIAVKFRNGRASVTPEVWALLEKHWTYTGRGGRKCVFRRDEQVPEALGQPVEIRHGALSAPVGKPALRAPSHDWDTAGQVALAKRIAEGEFTDPETAFAYEMANQRRKTVVRALTDAMLSPTDPGQEAA